MTEHTTSLFDLIGYYPEDDLPGVADSPSVEQDKGVVDLEGAHRYAAQMALQSGEVSQYICYNFRYGKFERTKR